MRDAAHALYHAFLTLKISCGLIVNVISVTPIRNVRPSLRRFSQHSQHCVLTCDT